MTKSRVHNCAASLSAYNFNIKNPTNKKEFLIQVFFHIHAVAQRMLLHRAAVAALQTRYLLTMFQHDFLLFVSHKRKRAEYGHWAALKEQWVQWPVLEGCKAALPNRLFFWGELPCRSLRSSKVSTFIAGNSLIHLDPCSIGIWTNVWLTSAIPSCVCSVPVKQVPV